MAGAGGGWRVRVEGGGAPPARPRLPQKQRPHSVGQGVARALQLRGHAAQLAATPPAAGAFAGVAPSVQPAARSAAARAASAGAAPVRAEESAVEHRLSAARESRGAAAAAHRVYGRVGRLGVDDAWLEGHG